MKILGSYQGTKRIPKGYLPGLKKGWWGRKRTRETIKTISRLPWVRIVFIVVTQPRLSEKISYPLLIPHQEYEYKFR